MQKGAQRKSRDIDCRVGEYAEKNHEQGSDEMERVERLQAFEKKDSRIEGVFLAGEFCSVNESAENEKQRGVERRSLDDRKQPPWGAVQVVERSGSFEMKKNDIDRSKETEAVDAGEIVFFWQYSRGSDF